MHSLADSAGALDALLPRALLPDSARNRLRPIASRIPSALAAAWGFECRLDGDDRVDLLYCVKADSASALREAEPAMRAFPADWSSAALDVWVEHDVVEAAQWPSVFFHFETPQGAGRLFPGDPTLARVLAALPDGAQLDQVGRMLSRADAPLRFVVQLPPKTTEIFLDDVGWPGDRAALRRRLAWLEDVCDYTVVDLEPDHPGLGLEAHFHRRRQPPDEPRWRRILDALCEEGLCVPIKRDDLLALPRAAQDPSIWGTECLLILSHLKISVPTPAAKAYIGFLRVRR